MPATAGRRSQAPGVSTPKECDSSQRPHCASVNHEVSPLRLKGRVSLMALVIVRAVAATASQADDGNAPNTKLTIVALNAFGGRAVFNLSCEPTGGDCPTRRMPVRPRKAARAGDDPQPFVCRGGPSSHGLIRNTRQVERARGSPRHRDLLSLPGATDSAVRLPQAKLRLPRPPVFAIYRVPTAVRAITSGDARTCRFANEAVLRPNAISLS